VSETAHETARGAIEESAEVARRLLDSESVDLLVAASEVIGRAFAADRKLLIFGNGGSASDAAHMATELVGRFLAERRALPAIPLSTDDSALTAIANDYGFERVFARQIEALGARGDVAFGISTSGRSANVVAALRTAREMGLETIGLTGADGGDFAGLVDVCLHAPARSTARVQEAHIVMIHVICELVEGGLDA
jgi:D-sedoheptulose 7-phosphate isomerase